MWGAAVSLCIFWSSTRGQTGGRVIASRISGTECCSDILFNFISSRLPLPPLWYFLPSNFFINLIEVCKRFMPMFGWRDRLDDFIHGGHVAASLVAALHADAGSVPGVQAAHAPQHLRVLRRPAPDTLRGARGLEAVGPHGKTWPRLSLRCGWWGRGGRDDPRPLQPQQTSGRRHRTDAPAMNY